MFPTRRLVGTLLALVVSAAAQTTPGSLNPRQGSGNVRQPPFYSTRAKAAASSGLPDWQNRMQPRTNRKMALPAANADPIFLTAPAYDSGGQTPSSIAAGDFNGDGNLDLAVVNSGSNNVGILVSNGDGTYQPAVTYPTAANPTYVIAADLNGDGIPDLAVAADNVIDVFLAKGDGTFRAPVSYNSGGFDTPSIAFGDFNHNGKTDLVVAHGCADSNCANGAVSLLLGNGDGTFQAPTNFASIGELASSIEVGDFNGDGKLDIAVAGDTAAGVEHDVVDILLGNGDGTFQPAVSYNAAGDGNGTIADFSTSLALGDFNSDGKLDLAVADLGNCEGSKTSCTGGTVNVLLNNGDGTFQPVVSYNAGDDVFGIAAGDINGDGKVDLVVANFCGLSDCTDYRDEGTVSVLLGNGDGTFQPSIAFNTTAGGGPTSLVAADFNHDGKLDLAIADQDLTCCGDGSVAILLGNGDGTLQTNSAFSTGGYGGVSILIGDFNGDGKADLAVGSSCYADPCINDSWLSVLPGNGDGTFAAATTYQFYGGGYQPAFIASGDFNHDGKMDLVATGANGNYGTTNLAGVGVFLGNGDGTFQTPATYSTNGAAESWVGVGDFNGDGKPDLAVANACVDVDCQTSSIAILLGNGDGTFQAPIIDSSVGQLSSFVIGDFNNDGKLDLAMPQTVCTDTACSASFIVLIGNGDSTFQPPVTLDTGGTYPFSAVTGDFNADGKADLAVMNACTNNDCTNGTIGILLGNGDGTFQPATTFNNSVGGWLATSDINGDGKTDLLVTGDDFVAVMLGNGDGSFQSPTSYFAGGYGPPAVGDLNGDGKPDVVVPSLETVNVLTNIAAAFRFATSTSVESSANPATTGQSIALTATVTEAVSGSPSGTVTFNDGGNSLGIATLTGNKATLATTLSAGSRAITTTYSGDSTFLASTSPALTETVNTAPPDFSLASSALAPVFIAPGGSSTATVTVTALDGFSGAVALTCSVTPAPAMAPTCAISPDSISAGTAATLTISTTGSAAFAPDSASRIFYAMLFVLGFVATGISLGWQKPKRARSAALGFALAVMLAFLVACGGSQSNGKSNQTPGATYTVTVSGTSAASLQHATTATFTVQ
jgi:hypothetical protein